MEKIRDKYRAWVSTLTPYNEEKIYVWLGPAGLGDKISNLPAFRYLKKINPHKKIVLFTEPLVMDLWKSCRYIDVLIPEGYVRGEQALNINPERDKGIRAWWSFYEHHTVEDHIVKSSVRYICDVDECPPEDEIDLTYELDIFDYDIPEIEKHKEELLNKADGKPIVGIAPTYTMFSRNWDFSYWEELSKMLKNEGFFVVSLGGNNDKKIKNVDLEKCGKYPIRQVPHILDIFESVFVVNSGMLHLASVNQDVPIVYMNVGQFPSNIIVPFRQNNIRGYNTLILEHDCPLREQCFKNHIEEIGINQQASMFVERWKKETGEDFADDGLLQKYICWHYCAKIMNKYSCGRMIKPKTVMRKFTERFWSK